MKKALLLLCATLLAFTCTQRVAGTIDETETGIGLVGYVYFKSNNQPAPNIITRLKHTGFYAVTDNNGYYSLTVTKDTLQKRGIDLLTLHDTLEYFEGSTSVADVGIASWIDTLPPLYIVQRNIYGKFNPANEKIGRIEAVLLQISGTDTIGAKIVPLWFNRAIMGFSRFVYFPNSSSRFVYSVYINVYNQDSVFIGRSVTITFPDDNAGDIEFPTFDPSNAFPVLSAGNDTMLSIGDTIRLHAQASDSFGGTIKKWEWDINNTGFRQTATGDTTISVPNDYIGKYTCILRVTDDDGNASVDTVVIVIGKWEIVPIGTDPRTPVSHCVSNGTSYIAYRDASFRYSVLKLVGSTWQHVGNSPFSDSGMIWGGLSLSVWNDVPYLVWGIKQAPFILGLIGTKWEHINDNKLPLVYTSRLCVWNGTPYFLGVTYSNTIIVMKYSGTAWDTIGSLLNTTDVFKNINLEVDKGTPYITFDSGSTKVMKYNGIQWEQLGTTGIKGDSLSLCVRDNTPYIATNASGLLVLKFNGVSWERVGDSIPGQADKKSMSVSNGIVYRLKRDGMYPNYQILLLQCRNGKDWEPYGEPVEGGYNTELCVDNNMPYFTFSKSDGKYYLARMR